jgi:hypothetical protein
MLLRLNQTVVMQCVEVNWGKAKYPRMMDAWHHSAAQNICSFDENAEIATTSSVCAQLVYYSSLDFKRA